MSGRDEENISADMLTMDELRIIALYLSNFYIPFGTSLDGAESRDTSKENCKTALINLGFDKDLAEEIVEMVMAASLSSASQLYMDADAVSMYCGYETDIRYYPDGSVETGRFVQLVDNIVFSNNDGAQPNVPIYSVNESYLARLNSSWLADRDSYTGFCISNGESIPLSLWGWDVLLSKKDWLNAESKTTDLSPDTPIPLDLPVVPVYYITEDNKETVFEFNNSTVSLWNAIMRNADYSNGKAGNAYYNDSNIHNAVNSSDDEIFSRMIFTQPMYVDWVGNIICDCGDERVIVLPACINPYTFSGDISQHYADNGVALYNNLEYNFNAVSTFGMSILQDSRLFYIPEGRSIIRHANGQIDIGDYTIKLSRGSRKDASWDVITGNKGSDEDGSRLLFELLGGDGLGINVPNSWANNWDDGAKTGHRVIDTRYIIDIMVFSSNDSVYRNTTCDLVYFNSEVSRIVDSNSFATVSVYDLLAGNGEIKISPFTDASKFNNITGNSYHNFINFSSPVDLRVLKSIFVTYAFAYCNAFPLEKTDSSLDNMFTVNMVFNDIFPKVEGYLQFNHVGNSTERAEQTLSMIYYLLHPSKGISYVSTLFKRKIGGILVSWHEDIVGATSSNYTTGGTHYLGLSGYVTTPSLKDVAWVSNLLQVHSKIKEF